jgi:uncharacterized RDD family membrane protein YckC
MKWYYADSGRQMGPVEDAALDDLTRTGVVRDDTLVWHEGLPSWQTLSAVRGTQTPPEMPSPATATGTGFCSECGRPFTPDLLVKIGQTSVCAECKPVYLQKLREGVSSTTVSRHYAGFWIRFVARLIDNALLTIVAWMILFAVAPLQLRERSVSNFSMLAGVGGLISLLNFALNIAYEVYFVSTRGGTIGKLILGLKIIRADGSRVSAGLAAGRYFAQIISAVILMIGYIMAGFDDEKRALHDRICETRVIYAR